jgi:hypothetical protein
MEKYARYLPISGHHPVEEIRITTLIRIKEKHAYTHSRLR